MDDIAACIKDHQYNEAIRKTVVDPEDALAKAILERIPPIDKKADVALEDFMSKQSFEVVVGCSLGRAFMAEGLKRQEASPWEDEKLEQMQDAYDALSELRASEDASSGTEAEVALAKFKSMAKDLTAADVAAPMEALVAAAAAKEPLDFTALETVLSEAAWKPGFAAFVADEALPAKYQRMCWYRDREATMDDFVIFRDLGRGAFGVVSGARHRSTGVMLALKGMNRKLIKGKKVLKMVNCEFEILKALGDKPTPFVVSLLYSFMDSTDLYLGLPLCTGGDLMFHLRSNRYGYGHERARFFAAEVLLGLKHLHSLGILYRDLKPENCLLVETGHVKISDLGLAVQTGYTPRTIGEKTMSGRAGTPGYWPPEMIQKKGYAFDADWWSYGVMLYEFNTGVCAFSETNAKMERNQATLTYELEFPEKCGPDKEAFPEEAKSLLAMLLDRNRATRLGAKPDAVEQIMAHPYFADIEWAELGALKSQPPWAPPADSINAASQEELQGRSKEHEFKNLKITPEDDIPGIAYSSRYHERDIVTVLRLDMAGKLKHLDATSSSSACAIL